jgi:hypothetical protein
MLAVLAALRAKVRGFIRLGPGVGLPESGNPGLPCEINTVCL